MPEPKVTNLEDAFDGNTDHRIDSPNRQVTMSKRVEAHSPLWAWRSVGSGIRRAFWPDLCERQHACNACRSTDALHPAARPLFGRFRPRSSDVLFVFEAPNLVDTTKAGYITYEIIARTDETGKFTKELFEKELGIKWYNFQVTNAVLCLPRNQDGKHQVKAIHVRNCAENLRQQIELLQPRVIASVGREALNALRRLYGLPTSGLRKVVGRPPQRMQDGRWLVPLFHTSRQGRWSRSEEEQRADWRALAKFARENGIALHD